jgi:hypothetical protein
MALPPARYSQLGNLIDYNPALTSSGRTSEASVDFTKDLNPTSLLLIAQTHSKHATDSKRVAFAMPY